MVSLRASLGLALAIGVWDGAEASLPPKGIDALMAEAPAHLQLQVLEVQPGPGPVDLCNTTLAVRRIFRDRTSGLQPGQSIELAIYCLRPPRPTEKSLGPMPGAMNWIEQSALQPGKLLEAYVFRDDGAWVLKLGALIWPIDRLTDRPLHDHNRH